MNVQAQAKNTALELNLIAVARKADELCDTTFEADMVAVLNKKRHRSIASLLGEMAVWLEDMSAVLVWDEKTRTYAVIDEPDGYVAPERTVVAGPYGSVVS
jgi:fructose-specific component phosphotransferase system IIB-like protein